MSEGADVLDRSDRSGIAANVRRLPSGAVIMVTEGSKMHAKWFVEKGRLGQRSPTSQEGI